MEYILESVGVYTWTYGENLGDLYFGLNASTFCGVQSFSVIYMPPTVRPDNEVTYAKKSNYDYTDTHSTYP